MAKPRRCRRGSAILFILFMVLAIGFIVATAAEFGYYTMDAQRRYEDAIVAQRTWDAAVSQCDALEAAGTLTLPYSTAFSLNGASGTVSATDNSSNMANSILVSGTLTLADGRTYPESSIIAVATSPVTPFYYALFVNSAFSLSNKTFSTGSSGSNGSIYFNGNSSITASGSGNTINGNVQSTGTMSESNVTVTGTTTQSASAVTFTTPPGAKYLSDETSSSSANSLNGYTFSSVTSGSPYPVLYMSAASVNVGGSFSGIGTVYFAGNVTINNTISYANGSSHVAFIVGGTLKTNGQSFVGYWYAGGAMTASGASLTDSNGAVIASSLTDNINTSMTLDPFVMNSTTQGNLLHLPGYTW